MNDINKRRQIREAFIKQAQDQFVTQVAEDFIAQYGFDLQHLSQGEFVDPKVPIGKDKFVEWIKNKLQSDSNYTPVSGIVENERMLKDFAVQAAEQVAKSETAIKNPMKDYPVYKQPIHVVAQAELKTFTPSGSIKQENIYSTPVEHSRYCPDHPGVMLRRKKDNVYQCPISGTPKANAPWKDNYDYNGGHEVTFETGVQNQTNQDWNNLHPLLPFLSTENKLDLSKGKGYDFDKLYDVKLDPPKRQDQINAHVLDKIMKVSQVSFQTDPKYVYDREFGSNINELKLFMNGIQQKVDNYKPSPAEAKQWELFKQDFKKAVDTVNDLPIKQSTREEVKTAQVLYAPTTMLSRQCPDHPGQQLTRIDDNVRQCPLDGKIYDYNQGFTTEDGSRHNGGSVANQNFLPAGSILVHKDASVKTAGGDRVHKFLYNHVLPYLPANAEYARRVLNYKFAEGVTLEQAIGEIEKADLLAQQQKQQATANIKSFLKK
jgi:uncharacterized protein (UPF0305 family)